MPERIVRKSLIISFSLFILLLVTLPNTAWSGITISEEGWLSIIWADGPPGSDEEQIIFFLNTQEGATRLFLDEELARPYGGVLALNNTFVAVEGTIAPSRLASQKQPVVQVTSLSLSAPPLDIYLPAKEASAAVTGSKPWVSILCKFSDHNQEPNNLAYFKGMYSSTKPGLDHYWREQSYNSVNVAGSSAYGWFVLPYPESHYNPDDTKGGANLNLLLDDCIAAADPSVDFSSYSGINMMFNTNFDNGYAWGGSRYLNLDGTYKRYSVTWEPPWGYADITVIAHEMGHGFGLPHSSGMYGETYDNEWDVMSDSWSNCNNSRDTTYGCLGQHTISHHKDRLGWIPAAERYVADEGNVTIIVDDLALSTSSNYRMVKIPLEGTSSRYYTLEVRRKTGYDIKLPGKGVIIHEVDTSRSRPANVVDIDGDGDTGDQGAIWTVGEIFYHPGEQFAVEVLSETATGFEIAILFPGPDLIVETSSISNNNPQEEESITLSVTIRNQGLSLADASTIRFYRSTDAAISTADTEIGLNSLTSLAKDETSAESISFNAPAEEGVFYFGACADSVTGELQTSNNCSEAVAVTVGDPPASEFPWNLFLPSILGFAEK